MSEQRFSEEQMRAVFARAAERQRRADERSVPHGLSLAEMQEVAAASGMDPAHIAAAVAELAAAPEPRKTFAGAPVEVTRVRHLDGPVADEAWARIVHEMRKANRDDGIAGQLGRTREWTTLPSSNGAKTTRTRIALEPDGDGPRVVLHRSVRDMAKGFTIGGSVTAFQALIFTAIALFAASEPGMWIPALFLLTLSTFFLGGTQVGARIWARRQEEQFERMLDRIELIVRDDHAEREAAGAPVRHADPAPAGRLDPFLLDDLDVEQGEPERARRPTRS